MNCKLRRILLAAASLLALAAQERFDLKVRDFFFAGFQGDSEALEKGMKICDEALALNPRNAEALVWHGSGLYYQSGQLFKKGNSEQGIQIWRRALREMDQAVEMAPDSVGVRIPRGAVLLTGSRFIHDPQVARPLLEKAVGDYEKTLELQANRLDTLPDHPKGELLIGLAEGYARLGNEEKAASYYSRLERDLPGTAYAKAAQKYQETKVPQAGCLGCHVSK